MVLQSGNGFVAYLLSWGVGPHGVRASPFLGNPMAHTHLDWKHGRPPRLPGYDYTSAGAYFITINTFQRKPLFGCVQSGRVRLTRFGEIVHEEWIRTGNSERRY